MSDSCERCGRRLDFWDMGDQREYFFKVMMGDFRSRMSIPHKFARRFGDRIQGKVKLKVCNGSTCTVVVARYPNMLVLEAGWEAFISTHDIRMGDFLVFKYNGNFQFEILIFDPSCCVKESSSVAGDICDHVKQRHGDRGPIEISSDSDDHQPMQSPRSERHAAPIQKKSLNQGNNKMNLSSSTSHLSTFESADDDDSSSEDNQEIHYATSYIFSPSTHLTQMQRLKVEKQVRTARSDIPMFGALMKKTNITRNPCYLGFCRKYADQYLPSEEQIIRLQRNGKVWQVLFRITKRNSIGVYQGWKEFVSDNKLQIGDICLFELLKNKKMLTMNIHIVRN